MRITINPDRCTGHGRCYVVAPDLITDDESGYGAVIGDGAVPGDREGAARKVTLGCPEGAVVITE